MSPEPDPPPATPPRSARTWTLLLCIWAIGLAVWVLYFAAIGYVLIRILFGASDSAAP